MAQTIEQVHAAEAVFMVVGPLSMGLVENVS